MEQDVRELLVLMTRRFGFLDKHCCRINGIDITLIQSHILYEVNRLHQPAMQQVAANLGTDITTFSRQVQTLVKAGLVHKAPDPKDGRVTLLKLTEEGQNVVGIIDEQVKANLEEVFAHMNQFEKETVIRSIQLLNQCMTKTRMCCSPESK